MKKNLSQLIKEIYSLQNKNTGIVGGFKLGETEGYWWTSVFCNGKDYNTTDVKWDKIGPNTPEKAVMMLLKEIKKSDDYKINIGRMEEKANKKAKTREKKRKPKMGVSGKGVFGLQKIIRQKTKKTTHKKGGEYNEKR